MITQDLWERYMPGEVPEGCTVQMFWAAREAMWAEEDLEYNIFRLQELRELWAGTQNKEFKRLIEIEGKGIKATL